MAQWTVTYCRGSEWVKLQSKWKPALAPATVSAGGRKDDEEDKDGDGGAGGARLFVDFCSSFTIL